MNDVYQNKVGLLIRLMPYVMNEGVFAVHGGSAIPKLPFCPMETAQSCQTQETESRQTICRSGETARNIWLRLLMHCKFAERNA